MKVKHKLIFLKGCDVKAKCTCGLWRYKGKGSNRVEAKKEHKKHIDKLKEEK